MTITEKAAYLKGLVEGRGLDPEAGEGKLWRVLSELAGDLAEELTQLRKNHAELQDQVDVLAEDVDFLEELYDDYDEDFDGYDEDEDDGYYPFGNFRDGEDEEEDEGMDVSYEVECPNCGESFTFDAETLEEGSVPCPNCGTALEFELLDPENGEE